MKTFWYWYRDFLSLRLHVIVYYNLVYILSIYLENGLMSTIEDDSFFTSRHLSVAKGHEEAVKVRLDRENIEINYPDERLTKPRIVTAQTGNITMTRMLLDRDDL